MPADVVLPTGTVTLLGERFGAPNQPKAYLRELYGDFETPAYMYLKAEAVAARQEIDTVE